MELNSTITARHSVWCRCNAGSMLLNAHDDVIKWKHLPRYWPFVRGIHRSPVNSPHKGQWRGALLFSLICNWINSWIKNREAGDLRRHRAHYDIIVMFLIARPRRRVMWVASLSQIYCSNQLYFKPSPDYIRIYILQYIYIYINIYIYIYITWPLISSNKIQKPCFVFRCRRFSRYGLWSVHL